jgi:hypothetical protein
MVFDLVVKNTFFHEFIHLFIRFGRKLIILNFYKLSFCQTELLTIGYRTSQADLLVVPVTLDTVSGLKDSKNGTIII